MSRSCREEIESMVRDNQVQNNSSQEGGKSTEKTLVPFFGAASQVTVVTLSGTRANHSNGDIEGAALGCKGDLNDQELPRINSLAYTTAHTEGFGHEGEHISSLESLDHAAGSPDNKRFSEGKGSNISISNHFQDAIKPPQRKQWSEDIRKEMANLIQHGVYELMPMNRISRVKRSSARD